MFINILQGKTGRWIEGESVGSGLYTDEIETCKIFIFFGEKNGKRAISMTHYDGYANVADIKHEENWFDKVNHCYICLKPEKITGAFKELFNILKEDLIQYNISYNITNIESNCDAAIVSYVSTEQKINPSIDWLDSANFERNIDGLINHPQACKMYSYYKTNIMFSEIEGELKHMAAYYKEESIKQPKENFYKYENNIQHISTICKRLAGAVNHRRVIYDGKIFKPLATHDQSLTPFATGILTNLPATINNSLNNIGYTP